ncbi:YgfZ/GcvT domain-containing protein [Hoeflea sp.]|uniref:CAF17-like 4Fe-4S cluster assembly/insertion protein YgfZ n=1 Tax=Hoeflea sp. TaxID=1940281 RepID=UPI00374A48D5
MPALILTDRTTVHVDGTEAEHFLQNLITANVETLETGCVRPAALLTPQGKILFDFLISRAPESGFHLDIATELADDFLKRLTLYKLRAKVSFDRQANTAVMAGWDSSTPDGALVDERFPRSAAVWRLYGSSAESDAHQADWDRLRIAHGVAESGSDYALSDVFPHDILMDKNHGVDFRKGCYVGQEVVSRMHHRGTARRRVVTVSGETSLPASGTSVQAGTKPVGELGTVTGNRALAIVRIDRVADALAAEDPLTADGVAVTLTLPEWTGLSFQPDNQTAADA